MTHKNRSGVNRIFRTFIIAILFGFSAFGQTPASAQALTLNQKIERELRGGEKHCARRN